MRIKPVLTARWRALTWDQVAKPLIAFCQNPQHAADKPRWSLMPSGPQTEETAQLRAEIERCHDLVHRYEQGRFMRLMRILAGWKRRFTAHA